MTKTLPRLPFDVVKDQLCVRCGACFDLCPKSLIRPDKQLYPAFSKHDKAKCNGCGLCMRACPSNVDFKKLYMECFGRITAPHDIAGVLKNVYVGYSANPEIRYMASSGGVVTELLLFLLKEGFIDQALVCGVDAKNPLRPNSYLAKTAKDIIDAAQSKYSVAPQMNLLGEIIRSEAKTAIVGLPCQIHAFRKMESHSKKRTANVKLVIGLVCHRTLEIDALPKMLEVSDIKPDTVKKAEYRSGKTWPGSVHVFLKNGQKKLLIQDYKNAFNYLRMFYSPQRCLTCIDFTAELSDLSVMDPWFRDESGNYPYSHATVVFTRNNKAEYYLGRAVANGNLHIEELAKNVKIKSDLVLPQEIIERSQLKYFTKLKKRIIPARIKRYQKAGKPYPVYHVDFPPPSLKDRISEHIDSMTRLPGRWEWSRDLGMRIAFSKFGNKLMRLRNDYKTGKAKFQSRIRKQS
ncbi:Coenzyme F420 hydrogenase/dehydrogenase, beta subunit C-terminal domain [Desulfococcaceae bacterium HSG9]|nr:Coenzyme F420 hydrogenase/dehydrogenase, beta subunit C-terminal domain [Desulfococcaceae bacterium HSG9]